MKSAPAARSLSRRRMLQRLGAGAAGLAAAGPHMFSSRASSLSAVTAQAGGVAAQVGEATGSRVAFPAGAVIRTVLTDVAPDTLTTATLFHEHLSFDWARVAPQSNRTGPAKDPAPVVEQLEAARAEGVGCVVDAGTTDIGRDMDLMRQIAARTRVHIVASGGLYMERTYPADAASRSEEQIADDLVREARMARYGAFGEIGETPDATLSALERKIFRAVGRAHLRTNLPIFTHNAYGTGPNVPRDAGLQQMDAFESVGVRPERVAIGHSCCLDDPSADVITRIARRGAFVTTERWR
jgi:phosphotriesterase-related protein